MMMRIHFLQQRSLLEEQSSFDDNEAANDQEGDDDLAQSRPTRQTTTDGSPTKKSLSKGPDTIAGQSSPQRRPGNTIASGISTSSGQYSPKDVRAGKGMEKATRSGDGDIASIHKQQPSASSEQYKSGKLDTVRELLANGRIQSPEYVAMITIAF